MLDLIEVTRCLALGQVLCFGLLVALKYRSSIGLLVVLNCIGVGCYIAMPLLPEPRWLFVVFATSIPAFFWLLCYRFFTDQHRPHWLIWPWWLIYMALWMSEPLLEGNLGQFIHRFIPQVMKLLLIVHVVYMALGGRREDLIESRLKLRVPSAIFFSVIVSFVIVVELWLQGPAPPILELIWSILMVVLVSIAMVSLLEVRPDFPLFDVKRTGKSDAEQQQLSSDPLISRIESAMTVGRFYAQHGATLSDLAATLSAQEYLLRKAINQGLGYANFNRFLNEYRIKEASARLISDPDLPVLTIALDVGFKSLSSFNKAFKETHQLTPTAFRQQKS